METRIVEDTVEIVRNGSGCMGCMPWETPYIILEDSKGDRYTWQSDNILETYIKHEPNGRENDIRIGVFFDVKMRVRGDRVWRMLNFTFN